MDNAGYVTLTRQNGLMRELQAVAHNIANASTTGFRREGVIFSEYVRGLQGSEAALSMARGDARQTWLNQGGLNFTGGQLDLAIEGEGFFRIETDQGERLTRAGHFSIDAQGEIVNHDGYRLLDDGGAPIMVPPGAQLAVSRDGTISADGEPVAQLGMVRPEDPSQLSRVAGTLLEARGGLLPAEDSVIHQGFLEESNVNPMAEMARLIEVHRAYEAGQKFLDREDERIRAVIQTLGK